MPVRIAKSDGTAEPFQREKLLASLHRAGANGAEAERVALQVEQELYDGITTGEIYAHAFQQLRGHRSGMAARYSLKRAVLDFGPTGFPFEAYVAELFRAEGHEAVIDQIIKGACVEHEVDVVVRMPGRVLYGEAKFHNTPGFRSDLKTALYVKARMDDIAKAHPMEKPEGLIITNTKFTSQAIRYAECAGLELLGWDYPQGNTLHDRIDRNKLYPVTALTTLSRREKTALLSDKTVLCTDLSKEPHALERVGIAGAKAKVVLQEVGALCVPGKDI